MLVGEGRGSEDGKDAGEDGDGLVVLGEVEVLIGGVVQVGVTGAIGNNGAAPDRADDVHVRGAALYLEGGFNPLLADGLEKRPDKRRVLWRPVGRIGPPEPELPWTGLQVLDLLANVVRGKGGWDSN